LFRSEKITAIFEPIVYKCGLSGPVADAGFRCCITKRPCLDYHQAKQSLLEKLKGYMKMVQLSSKAVCSGYTSFLEVKKEHQNPPIAAAVTFLHLHRL
jgi:hypothetical protein